MEIQDSDVSAGQLWYRRGVAAARAGLHSVAASHFQKAAETLPDNPQVWLWLAWVSSSPDNAIHCLTQVLELSPQHPAAIAGLVWLQALVTDTPANTNPAPRPAAVSVAERPPVVCASIAPPPLPEPAVEAPPSEVLVNAAADHLWDTLPSDVESTPLAKSASNAVSELDVAEQAEHNEPKREEVVSEPPRRRWHDVVPGSIEPPPAPAAELPAVPPPLRPISDVQPRSVEPGPSLADSSDSTPAGGIAAHDQTAAADVDVLTQAFRPSTFTDATDGRPLVMVVDDSPTVRKLVSLTLERRGYRVVSAFDGVAAIKELGSCRPDLILLDINMPRLDGYRLCKLIKKHEATQSIPVVMLSGKDGMFDKLRGRLVGCSDYITKPFEADALTHKVAKYVTPVSSS